MNNDFRITNRIFNKFHAVEDRKHVLLHLLSRLNEVQNQKMFVDTDIKENKLFYDYYTKEEMEENASHLEAEMSNYAFKSLDVLESLIIEIQIIIDLYEILDNKDEVQTMFHNSFMPFIHTISSFETLFLCKNHSIQELLFKTKLLGTTLQKVIDFEIQNEVKL